VNNIVDDLRVVFGRELRAFEREIELFPDDEMMWQTPPGVTNSAANLALHVCGNLQHFIGHRLGDTGYVRDREREFSRRSGTRAELVAELRKTADVVDGTLSRLSDEQFAGPYPENKRGLEFSTHRLLVHLSIHLGFHLGQAGYLRRVLTGQSASSAPISLEELRG